MKKIYIAPLLERIPAKVESYILAGSGGTVGTEDKTGDEMDDNGGAKGNNAWSDDDEDEGDVWSHFPSLWD